MADAEKKNFLKTVTVFKYYKQYAYQRVIEQQNIYKKLSADHKKLIPDFPFHLERLKACINTNDQFINLIVGGITPHLFEGDSELTSQDLSIESFLQSGQKLTNSDTEKVASVLKQFVRDWSSLGAKERKQSYDPVVAEIKRLFKGRPKLSDVKILVPGAGLGRLAWDLANAGYTCQGNEFSLYMLLPAHFVLNKCSAANEHTLHPFVLQFCNNLTRENQIRAVSVPDVVPSDIPEDVQFSMVAGDFTEVYTEADTWDCVATVYFIDTAHNVLAYLDTIYKVLKPGGYWINFGPLLYHFADIPGQESIELSYEEVRRAIDIIGFECVKETRNVASAFTQDPDSMLQYTYQCVFGVFRKPLPNT